MHFCLSPKSITCNAINISFITKHLAIHYDERTKRILSCCWWFNAFPYQRPKNATNKYQHKQFLPQISSGHRCVCNLSKVHTQLWCLMNFVTNLIEILSHQKSFFSHQALWNYKEIDSEHIYILVTQNLSLINKNHANHLSLKTAGLLSQSRTL
jgi:hypothetical protein